MKRAKHNLSHYRLATCNMGELVPLSCVPVLPGDTVQNATSAMIRLSPLNTPVMHPTSVRVHHFFVPNRIVMPEWEDFITGGPDGADATQIPVINATSRVKGDLLDHLGVSPTAAFVDINALPVYGFNKIFNEFYRDQDLVPERALTDVTIPFVAWEKDYFGISRPWTQKGPDVTLPAGENAPVINDPDGTGSPIFDYSGNVSNLVASGTAVNVNTSGSGPMTWNDPNLIADLSAANSPSVNDWRAAFSLQRYQEARARYGSRFTEYLRYLGITPSDARLQRPEYLGGGSTRVNFSEVLQTTPNEAAEIGVGDMYGHGIAGVRSNRYRKFFEEHGYVYTLLSVRPKALYVNGIPREFRKTTKEDYFQKELANLGQQELMVSELYGQVATQDDVFSYTDRYQEYRNQPSQIAGDFRDTLNAYHMGRDLAQDVALNQAFTECDPSDRIFQVGKATADTLWVMANHQMVARRIVPKRANPRIL